jgi:hypothetical protein
LLYPAWQFEGDSLLPGLETFLAAYEGYHSFVLVDMLLTPDDSLADRNLLTVIRDGDDEALRRYIAQDETESLA